MLHSSKVMATCDHCKKGTLLEERTERAREIKCSFCGRGWHIPLTPSHTSPCDNPFFQPPVPREIIRDEFHDFNRDEKPIEEDGE